MKSILSQMQIIEVAKNIQISPFDINIFEESMKEICAKDSNIVHKIYNMDMNDFEIDKNEIQQFFQRQPQAIIILTIVDKFETLSGLVFYNSGGRADPKIEVFYVDPNSKPVPEQISQKLFTPVKYLLRALDIEQQGVYVSDMSAKFLIGHYHAIILEIKTMQAQSIYNEPLEGYEEYEEYEEYDDIETYISSSELNNEQFRNITFLNTTKLQPKNTTNLYTLWNHLFKKPDGGGATGVPISSSSEADALWYQQYLSWRDAQQHVV